MLARVFKGANAIRKYATEPVRGEVAQALIYSRFPDTGHVSYLFGLPAGPKIMSTKRDGLRLFGGMVDKGEDLMVALCREVKEEIIGDHHADIDALNPDEKRASEIIEKAVNALEDNLKSGNAEPFEGIFRPNWFYQKQKNWHKTQNSNFRIELPWEDFCHLAKVGRKTAEVGHEELRDVITLKDSSARGRQFVYRNEARAMAFHRSRIKNEGNAPRQTI